MAIESEDKEERDADSATRFTVHESATKCAAKGAAKGAAKAATKAATDKGKAATTAPTAQPTAAPAAAAKVTAPSPPGKRKASQPAARLADKNALSARGDSPPSSEPSSPTSPPAKSARSSEAGSDGDEDVEMAESPPLLNAWSVVAGRRKSPPKAASGDAPLPPGLQHLPIGGDSQNAAQRKANEAVVATARVQVVRLARLASRAREDDQVNGRPPRTRTST